MPPLNNLLELTTAEPVSTYTNPHGQIDALIAQHGADQIALEDMLYGSIRNPVPRVEAPGLGLLEWVDTGPLIGMKALAGLVGKGGQRLSKLQKTAKKMFGTTDDATEAGYILDDGSMLDFSGKAEGGTRGVRAYDHREINRVGDSGVGGLDEFDDVGMFEFMEEGGIRWGPESNLFNMWNKPSEKQLSKMKKIYNDKLGNRRGLSKMFTIELQLPETSLSAIDLRHRRLYETYDASTPWKTIERDIRQFYETGKGPSIIQQFHR